VQYNLLKYTKKAFKTLPYIKKPRILDIGCGSGVPTIELARLSHGEITAVDTNQILLNRLAHKVEAMSLSHRVKVLNCSMARMDFPEESFDIIWAEGSIAVVGFAKGLQEWRQFLKTGGFLVIHDDLGDIEKKMALILEHQCHLIDYFILDQDIWWNQYYGPLEGMLNQMKLEYPGFLETCEMISSDKREIGGFKRNPERYQSVFFITQKAECSEEVICQSKV
jgi:ubiquinone/menaquinone biosynthesis C-methylase UbiE